MALGIGYWIDMKTNETRTYTIHLGSSYDTDENDL